MMSQPFLTLGVVLGDAFTAGPQMLSDCLSTKKQRERRGKLRCIVCLALVSLPLLFESDGAGECSAQPLQQRQLRVAAHVVPLLLPMTLLVGCLCAYCAAPSHQRLLLVGVVCLHLHVCAAGLFHRSSCAALLGMLQSV
jgi:hypothetical protein